MIVAFGGDLWSAQLQRVSALLHRPAVSRAAFGALAVAMLLYAGETTKFVTTWAAYKGAVQSLARSTVSDPALGDSQFVSSGANFDDAQSRIVVFDDAFSVGARCARSLAGAARYRPPLELLLAALHVCDKDGRECARGTRR